MSITKRIHGILFVAGDEGVSLSALAETLEISMAQARQAIQSLTLQLQNDTQSPVEIVNYNGKYRLITLSELHPDVEKFAQLPMNQKLSRAAIETLAIIAYRQPITRIQIDEIRGVSSSSMIHRLISRDLIKEIGRLEAPGRPFLYGTTDYFMNYFGLTSFEQLPPIDPLNLQITSHQNQLFQFDDYEMTLYNHDEKES